MIEKVIVGGKPYNVKEENMNEGKDILKDNFHLGLTLDPIDTIKVDSELSEQQKEITFVHELLHAIFFVSGAQRLVDNEEAIVSVLTNTTYQVLKDNDFSWLKDTE